MMPGREVQPPAGVYLRAADWHVGAVSREVTSAIDGSSQVVMSPSERWRCTLSYRVVRQAQREEWEGFIADLRGRGNYVRLAPLRSSALETVGWLPFSTGEPFSTDLGWLAEPWFRLSAAIRAREITLNTTAPSAIRRGTVLSISGTAHRVTSIEAVEADHVRLRIAPGLRSAVLAGTFARLTPTVPMRLDDDDQGRLNWPASQYADASVSMIEVIL